MKFRVKVTFRNWIGKPDPSGFGFYFRTSDNRAELEKFCAWRRCHGDKVGKIEEIESND